MLSSRQSPPCQLGLHLVVHPLERSDEIIARRSSKAAAQHVPCARPPRRWGVGRHLPLHHRRVGGGRVPAGTTRPCCRRSSVAMVQPFWVAKLTPGLAFKRRQRRLCRRIADRRLRRLRQTAWARLCRSGEGKAERRRGPSPTPKRIAPRSTSRLSPPPSAPGRGRPWMSSMCSSPTEQPPRSPRSRRWRNCSSAAQLGNGVVLAGVDREGLRASPMFGPRGRTAFSASMNRRPASRPTGQLETRPYPRGPPFKVLVGPRPGFAGPAPIGWIHLHHARPRPFSPGR